MNHDLHVYGRLTISPFSLPVRSCSQIADEILTNRQKYFFFINKMIQAH